MDEALSFPAPETLPFLSSPRILLHATAVHDGSRSPETSVGLGSHHRSGGQLFMRRELVLCSDGRMFPPPVWPIRSPESSPADVKIQPPVQPFLGRISSGSHHPDAYAIRPLLVGRCCLLAGRGTPEVSRSCGSSWRLPAAASCSCGHPAGTYGAASRAARGGGGADPTWPARGFAGRVGPGSEISAWRAVSLGWVRDPSRVRPDRDSGSARPSGRPIRSVGRSSSPRGRLHRTDGSFPGGRGWVESEPSARPIRRRACVKF